jgi:hypothetical protein
MPSFGSEKASLNDSGAMPWMRAHCVPSCPVWEADPTILFLGFPPTGLCSVLRAFRCTYQHGCQGVYCQSFPALMFLQLSARA